ncbi:heparan-alpha-glucosaminide N-acetyltransferase domain-containing protein [uncultured Winogradskyella sp.]|uniref:heparan-alpha-glucosaminide N-acetyltransferase domain-containing protein n=1 Tax=uncultured Winogradskyella sp. TaxID=395353 RepID=UPI00261664E8|nr:heparan-alpha-glucosaminide N-acetyltransferase domain-containing protein [uncultured Winogradskyella sp.]
MSATKRLYFIDAVRAFAILMMLQGHFIDTVLDVQYRDESHMLYSCWKYFRGLTAPTFFTISGLIFSYLLIKAKQTGCSKQRIRKGLLRGLMLIGIGYALRIPIFEWLIGEFKLYFLIVDVLQCIGLSLIIVILLYNLVNKKTYIFSGLMLLLAIIIFTTEPLYRTLVIHKLPLIFSNYLTKVNGSVFTIIPWFGYICFGAFIATLFYKYLEHPKFKISIITVFFVVGMVLIHKSSWLFKELYLMFNVDVFYGVANYNYLYTRLGNVLVLFAVFYLAENYVKQSLILKIGQKTLSIYVIHFIIIYGSFTGFGLNTIIGKTLNPWQAVIGALLFLTTVCFIAFYYVKSNAFVYSGIRKIYEKVTKQSRYKV